MSNLFRVLSSDKSSSGAGGWALAALRVGLGLGMILGHGLPKLMSFSERASGFSDPLGVGSPLSLALVVFAEVFCAGLVVLGVFTRLAAIPVIFAMGVVVFAVQHGDVLGKGELAAVYAVGFIALLIGGGGNFSLGRLLRG
jgi:putative oxidoreductase